MEDPMEKAKRVRPRAKYKYKVPAGMVDDFGGIKSITIVELTAEEELLAAKRAHGDAMRLALELAKESLRYVDDQELNTGDDSSDRAWARLGPKGRTMVLTAYSQTHTPKGEDVADFLSTCETVVE